MLNRISIGAIIGVVAAVMAVGLGDAKADESFTSRENVNLMNSYTVSVTAAQESNFPGLDANNLRSSETEGAFWDGDNSPPGGTNALTINFGTTRDLKTLNINQFSGSEGTAFTVETSPDGTAWTPQLATFTPNGSEGQLVLNSAVDAQYLRLTATAINDGNGPDRWVVTALRVFGDTGTLTDPSGKLDLVSGTGGPDGGTVTLTRNGSVSETDTIDSQYIDDALYPIQRQVMYNMGTGDGFTLGWNTAQPISFDHVGLYFPPSNFDPNATFTIETSTDNVSFVNALTQPGGLVQGMNYFALSGVNIGQYLRFTYTSTTSADNRIGDVQVFGSFVPEPSTALLLGVGGLLTLRRRRAVKA